MLGKMVVTLIAVTFSVVALTAPTIHDDQSEAEAYVVRFENKSNQTGKYSVVYELSNGIIHAESGFTSNGSNIQARDIVEGSYWFMGPDNVTYLINYYVDEDGFHPQLGSGAGVSFKLLASSVG